MFTNPIRGLAINPKTNEFNEIINDFSFYKFNLDYKNSDLAFDNLHLTSRCISEKLKIIKAVLNLAISNLQFGMEEWYGKN